MVVIMIGESNRRDCNCTIVFELEHQWFYHKQEFEFLQSMVFSGTIA
jgi:hypothetical protein